MAQQIDFAFSPRDALERWAERLKPNERKTLKGILNQALSADPANLRLLVNEHIRSVEAARQENEFLDLDKARSLANVAQRILDEVTSLPAHHRAIALAAVLYFITKDDAADDYQSPTGFNDDERVIHSALTAIDRLDLMEP